MTKRADQEHLFRAAPNKLNGRIAQWCITCITLQITDRAFAKG
jgi:hypothetical protein